MMNRFYKIISDCSKELISFNQRIYSVVFRFLILVFLLLFISGSLKARELSKVLIINSDNTVDKYSHASIEFKSKVPNLIGEIDLGSKWLNEEKIKNNIIEADPDIIFCIGSQAYQMAYKVRKKKVLVFSLILNWHRLPMSRKTYGISNELPQGMQLTMYRYLFPDINKIGLLYSNTYNKQWFDTAVENVKDLDIKLTGRTVSKPGEIGSALKELLPKVDALWLIPDPIVLQDIESVNKIFKLSHAMRKPIFAYDRAFIGIGAALIISADISTMIKQSVEIVMDLLENQKISKKVQDPIGSHIILNMKKVKEYRLKLNEDALDSVNEIIE